MQTDASIAELFRAGVGTRRIAEAAQLSQRRVQQIVQHMQPDVAVHFRNLKELPHTDMLLQQDTEPPEAPPAGVHYIGDRVKVERSNGGQSYASIVEYDEVMEPYVVDVGGGTLKVLPPPALPPPALPLLPLPLPLQRRGNADAGAHVAAFTDASCTTFTLSFWCGNTAFFFLEPVLDIF